MTILSNYSFEQNAEIREWYKLDVDSAFVFGAMISCDSLLNSIDRVSIQYKAITYRNQQSFGLLDKVKFVSASDNTVAWLNRRNVYIDAREVDYSLLTRQDMLDLFIIPGDHVIKALWYNTQWLIDDKCDELKVCGPVFPDYRFGRLVGFCIRNITSDKRFEAQAKYTFSCQDAFLYGFDLYEPDDTIVITEGVFDAIALRSIGYKAIAIGSAYPTVLQLGCLAAKYSKFSCCFDDDFYGWIGAYVVANCFKIDEVMLPSHKDAAESILEKADTSFINISKHDLARKIIDRIPQFNSSSRLINHSNLIYHRNLSYT